MTRNVVGGGAIENRAARTASGSAHGGEVHGQIRRRGVGEIALERGEVHEDFAALARIVVVDVDNAEGDTLLAEREGDGVAGGCVVLVGEGLADRNIVAGAKFRHDCGDAAAGEEIAGALHALRREVHAGERDWQTVVVDLVRAAAVHGGDAGDGLDERGEFGRKRWMADQPRRQGRPDARRGPQETRRSIQLMTVSRKLPTMMPMATIMAMAVESAATSTEVRRNEPARLREARSASAPKRRPMA